jgi:hypothetical protein
MESRTSQCSDVVFDCAARPAASRRKSERAFTAQPLRGEHATADANDTALRHGPSGGTRDNAVHLPPSGERCRFRT